MVTFETDLLDGGITRVRLGGSLDIQGTDSIEAKMTPFMASKSTYLILDLSGVPLMASLGIGLIFRTLKSVRNHGGNIVLLNPQPAVALVLERTAANKIVAIAESLGEACELVKTIPGG